MYPASFEYHRAASVEEAVGLLTRYKDDAKLLAGGHSLIPMMKLRLAQPKHLIDIGRVGGLAGIKEEGGKLRDRRPRRPTAAVESSAAVRQKCPMLSEAAALIGDPQVRNYGTVGGSVAHSDPAADWPALMLALGAEIKAVGPKGARTIKADDFFKDLFTTALGADEILTEIRIPTGGHGGAAYMKHPHPASRFAVCGVAAAVSLDAGGKCTAARVGVTGVGSHAIRAKGVEAALTGKTLDAATIAAASEKAAEGIEINADLQGSVEYKAHLTRVYTRRALEKAVERAKGAK